MLEESIPVKRSTVGIPGRGNVLFGDLQNRPLQLPPLTWPYRRALVRHAKSAYHLAAHSPSSHAVADETTPNKDHWDALHAYLSKDSPECSQCIFLNASETD